MVLPLWKLGTLVLKSISKPVAGKLKQQVSVHPRLRQSIVNMAQRNHRFTTQMQRRIYGHSTNVAVRPLDEEKAIQHAVDLIGEIFVFSVAGALVIFEVHRSSKSEARKEDLRKRDLEGVRQSSELVAEEIEIFKRRIQELEKHHGVRPRTGILNFKQGNAESGNTEKAA